MTGGDLKWLLASVVIGLCVSIAPPRAWAHDLAVDQVILMPNSRTGELRGQVTFDPHRTRALDAVISEQTNGKVIAAIAGSIEIRVNGQPLRFALEVRELWVRAGPTVGDIVMLRATLPREARELEVRAGPSLKALIVTIQVIDPSGAPQSRSTMVLSGGVTPPYRFANPADGWTLGGADVFSVNDSESSVERDAVVVSARATAADSNTKVPNHGWSKAGAAFFGFFALGFRHVVPQGWDHLLFVIGLVLGCGLGAWRLLANRVPQ